MNLLRAAGILEVPTGEELSSEAVLHRLASTAADFLRAGGTLTLSDWRDLTLTERAAFVAAGHAVDAERAARRGAAAQGLAGAAGVLSEADGGEAAASVDLRRLVTAVAASGRAPTRGGPS